MSWPGLVQPPRLQHSDTPTSQQRNASRLELFFDLAFVLVVAEVSVGLGDNLTLHGLLVFAGLFTSIWWAWAGFTIYANRFDTDDLLYRLAKLTAMLAVVGVAASTTQATTSQATQFALCQATLRLLLVALYLRAARHVVQARSLIGVYLAAEGLAAALWLTGAVLPAPVRYACWALAVTAEAAAPILATLRAGGLPLHLEHLPERFGLLVILVLGQSIAAITVGVHQTNWQAAPVTIAILGFVIPASLWWIYFDLTGAAATSTLTRRAGHRSTPRHDLYAYGHWPLTLGLAATGVGLEGAILHGDQPTLGPGTRWLLCGGVALYLLAVTAIRAGVAGSPRKTLPWPALGIPLTLTVALASNLRPIVVVAAVTVVLMSEVIAGLTTQHHHPPNTPTPNQPEKEG